MIAGMESQRTRDSVRDRRIERVVELLPPATLLDELPLGDERAAAVVRGREEVAAVLDRDDDRLLVVAGPCSVHDPEAALDYAIASPPRRRTSATTCWSRCGSTSRSHARPSAGRGSSTTPTSTAPATSTPACGSPASSCSTSSTSACWSAASSSIRSRRSTSPTPSPGGRSARGRARARPTASSAPASPCRSGSRTEPTATCKSRSTPSAPRAPSTRSRASMTRGLRRSSTRRETAMAT